MQPNIKHERRKGMAKNEFRKGQPYWLTRGEDFYSETLSVLKSAIEKGYSVVEIKRVFNMGGAKQIYQTLRTEHVIPVLRKKGGPKHVLPEIIDACIKKVNLGFPQWCNSRLPGLNTGETCDALLSPIEKNDPASVKAHTAFYLDFANEYHRNFQTRLDVETYSSKTAETIVPDILVTQDHSQILAYVVANPQIRGTAPNAPDAVKKVMFGLAVKAGLEKLKELPDQRQCSWFSCMM